MFIREGVNWFINNKKNQEPQSVLSVMQGRAVLWYCCCCCCELMDLGSSQVQADSGTVVQLLRSVKAEWNLKAQSYLASLHVVWLTQKPMAGLPDVENLGFKLFSLDVSHKPWQTILRRYLNWIAPWEEKIVTWQYNSSKVSPPTNWKVLQDCLEPKILT